MSNAHRRGPRELAEILGELFTVRGYGRLRAVSELEDAWNSAVGEAHCRQTRLGEIRRGVVTVIVAHPTLLAELAGFRKPELLAALRACTPGSKIQDIRFRVGAIDNTHEPSAEQPPLVGNPKALLNKPKRPRRNGSRQHPPQATRDAEKDQAEGKR
jgi:hypothetical protein